MKSLLILFSLALPIFLSAQNIAYPKNFKKLLKAANIDFFEPLESRYKDFAIQKNDLARYDFCMASRKEKMEIRYSIIPWSEENFMSQNPHLLIMRTVSSIATNEQEYIITATQMNKFDLQNDFNADWGMTYFFRPKEAFSSQPHCRVIGLHKEGKGTAIIYYLFDDVKNEALNTRYYALRFLKETIIID